MASSTGYLLLMSALFLQCLISHSVKIKVVVRVQPFLNRIHLHCQDNNGEDLTTSVQFYRTKMINAQIVTKLFTNYTPDGAVAKFNVAPELEGEFSCASNNSMSSNNITLVAYPYLDSSFTLPQEYKVQVGHTSSPLPCGFVPGGLANLYYEVEWWRGIVRLDLSGSKYEMVSNYSLLVHNATMRDNSGGYYCHIRVFNVEENKWYSNSSPDIKLNVYGGLSLTSSFQHLALKADTSPSFTCIAQGLPQPQIKWLLNNSPPNSSTQYTIQEQVSSSLAAVTVTSTLTLTNIKPESTGRVECVAYTSTENDIQVDIKGATIIILDHNFIPQLTPTEDGGLTLSVQFPYKLPDIFSIHIRYVSTVDPQHIYNTVLTDYTFIHTMAVIDYRIPDNKLPTFVSFRAQVALEVFGVMGDYSELSAQTALQTTPPTNTVTTPTITVDTQITPCTCDSVMSLYVGIALLGAVLIILILIILILVLFLCTRNHREPLYNKENLQATRYNNYNEKIELNNYASQDELSIRKGNSNSSRSTVSPSSDSHTYISPSGSSRGRSIDTQGFSTPSRPSSQESYSLTEGRSTTASPPPHNVYESINKPTSYKERKQASPSPYENTNKPTSHKGRTQGSSTSLLEPTKEEESTIATSYNQNTPAAIPKTMPDGSMSARSSQTTPKTMKTPLTDDESEAKQNQATPLSPSRSDPSTLACPEKPSHPLQSKGGLSSSMAISPSMTSTQETKVSPSLKKQEQLLQDKEGHSTSMTISPSTTPSQETKASPSLTNQERFSQSTSVQTSLTFRQYTGKVPIPESKPPEPQKTEKDKEIEKMLEEYEMVQVPSSP